MNEIGKEKVTMSLAISWAVLFTLAALCTSITASLMHVKWVALDGQDKLLLVMAIFGNWSTVIMAFLSKTVARLESKPGTGSPTPVNGGTDLLNALAVAEKTAPLSPVTPSTPPANPATEQKGNGLL